MAQHSLELPLLLLEHLQPRMKVSLVAIKAPALAPTMSSLFPATVRPVICFPKNMKEETQASNPYCFGASAVL